MTLTGTPRIRVLIVDDSLFMRAAIKKVLSDAGCFEIVGQARDGEEAIAKVLELEPQVVTMDYNMPKLNGAEAVRQIMKLRPTPVIMFSANTRHGARETFAALAAGAVDFCTKPSGEVSANFAAIETDLVAKLRAAAESRPRAMAPLTAPKPNAPVATIILPPSGPRLVIIAVSTGGPAALSRVIPSLPADASFATIVVQHMPAQFTAALAERLDGLSAVKVREAREGDLPGPGLVLIAPGDRHVDVDEGGVLHLTDAAHVNGCRPAADVTMKAAARAYGRRLIGVVMTGMGKDGTAGLAAIKNAAGRTMAQDEDSSVIFGMPRAAIEAGVVDEVLSLEKLAGHLSQL
jgi:two-component system chemotaxis response regulator CheB